MIILHGEDTVKSYARLAILTQELKSRNVEIIIQDASDIDITYLRQEMGSKSLFENQKCFVIKNLLGGAKSKNKDGLIAIIKQNQDHEIILWENKALTATALKSFPSAKLENFAMSPIIFKFLDSLRPNNTQNILISWRKLLQEGLEPEFVFAMVIRQVKLLIQAKTNFKNLKLAPYPAKLINTQTTYFALDHLLDLYQELYQIDIKIKTGTSTTTMDHLLGHFLQKI